MKIEVTQLKDDEVLALCQDIIAKDWDMDGLGISFIGNIHLDSDFVKIHQEILVDTLVTTKQKITCSRCLEEVEKEVKYRYKNSYALSELGEYLDIDNDIREDILLNFPIRALCKQDCKGLCSQCGQNLNKAVCDCKK